MRCGRCCPDGRQTLDRTSPRLIPRRATARFLKPKALYPSEVRSIFKLIYGIYHDTSIPHLVALVNSIWIFCIWKIAKLTYPFFRIFCTKNIFLEHSFELALKPIDKRNKILYNI